MTPLTWLEVDLAAVRANVTVLHERAGSAELAAVVKADGYGLGAAPIATAAIEAGAGRLCVFTLDEAAALRAAGVSAPILVLGPLRPEDASRVGPLDVAVSVTRPESIGPLGQAATAAERWIPVHVKVDVGMYRLGAPADVAGALVAAVRAEPGLRLEGFYSHFPNADEAGASDTEQRFARFLPLAAQAGVPVRHVANTATLLRFPHMALDLVRPGAGLYGFGSGAAAAPALETLQPVVRWRARIVQVHDVAAGKSVSYGGAWTAARESRVGVVAVGYADGFRRILSNRGAMLVRGRRAPVVGTVCMDLTLVDLSDVPQAAVGDVATLIGRDGEAAVSIESFAALCGTIPYEVLTGLGPRPARVYIGASRSEGEESSSGEAAQPVRSVTSPP
ncbi:MAG: alanine racemase [Chloroflexi bacterium]|nr:MAG: alanine racemase [Chloroflexota bacterium]